MSKENKNFSLHTPENYSPLPERIRQNASIGADGCPWLDDYVDFSRIWSPDAFDGFHEICGLFVLSTISARRVMFHLGRPRFTNLYLGMVGRTSIYAKTTTAEIALDVLRKSGLDWLLAPDSSTPQKLIADMSNTDLPKNYYELDQEMKTRAVHRTITAGQRGWFAEEYGGHISAMMQKDGVMNPFRSLIRLLDDGQPRYENATVSRGNDIIVNPFLTLLVSLTPADLIPYAKKGAALWGDGFFARFALIAPHNSELSFGRFPNEPRVIPSALITPMHIWHKRLGLPRYEIKDHEGEARVVVSPYQPDPVKISDQVHVAFYESRDALREITFNLGITDLDGNYSRFAEKALRIAALFASVAGSHSIELNHWVKALDITERWRLGLHELYSQVATMEYISNPSKEEKIVRAIQKKGSPTTREISQVTGIPSTVVNEILKDLQLAKAVHSMPDGKTIRFSLGKSTNGSVD